MIRVFSSISLIWALVVLQPLQAGVDPVELKAVMIQRIATFIEWPECSKESVAVAIYGDSNELNSFKKVLSSQKIDGRSITLKEYENLTDTSQLSACDILYLGDTSTADRKKILEKFSKKSILIVGSTRDDSLSGVSVVLLKDGSRYRILINQDALKNANLKADYRLLKLAEIVEGK